MRRPKLALGNAILGFMLLIGMAACASPKVKYEKEVGDDYRGLIKFYLADSDITLTKKTVTPASSKQAQGGPSISTDSADVSCVEPADCFARVDAVVVPKEYKKGGLYAVVPTDNIFGSTNLAVSYVPGTHLVKQMGVDVKDYASDFVNLAGAILKAGGVKFGALEQLGPSKQIVLKLPFVINGDDARNQEDWLELSEKNKGWWYRLIIDPNIPPGTVDAQNFFSMYSQNATDVFVISSCREATLYFAYDSQKPKIDPLTAPIRFQLTIIDPVRVETIKLPIKGAIKVNNTCGADVESQPDTNPSPYSLIKQLMDQTKAISNTQKQSPK